MNLKSAKLGIIVFARMNSSRLPGKALMPLGNMPLLLRVIKRAERCEYPVYVATSTMADDDAIVALAEQQGVSVFRGSKEDVLQRAADAAHHFKLDAFARLCGDRPLFDVQEMKTALQMFDVLFQAACPPDLISNHLFKQQAPGLTTEVVATKTLDAILQGTLDAEAREHMTKHIYDYKEQFTIVSLAHKHQYADRFVVDTPRDYARMQYVFANNASVDMSVEEGFSRLSEMQST